jgi:hypothetical protein
VDSVFPLSDEEEHAEELKEWFVEGTLQSPTMKSLFAIEPAQDRALIFTAPVKQNR